MDDVFRSPKPTGEDAIRDWLIAYAWVHPEPEFKRAEVDCIMAQDGWRYLEDSADRYAGMSEAGGGPEAFDDAYGFALSALYECHDKPHLTTCPHYKEVNE